MIQKHAVGKIIFQAHFGQTICASNHHKRKQNTRYYACIISGHLHNYGFHNKIDNQQRPKCLFQNRKHPLSSLKTKNANKEPQRIRSKYPFNHFRQNAAAIPHQYGANQIYSSKQLQECHPMLPFHLLQKRINNRQYNIQLHFRKNRPKCAIDTSGR